MNAKVSFLPVERARGRLMDLLDAAGFRVPGRGGGLAAVKLHFGEEGNRNYVAPEYCAEVVAGLKSLGYRVYLVETSTLYRGPRQERASHIELAHRHGFTPGAVGAEVRILDGERGEAYEERSVNLECYRTVKVAEGLSEFDLLVVMSHFKGHMVAGFGGAIKNLGMGLSAKGGKLEMHSLSSPYVKKDRCTSCGICAENCPVDAVSVTGEGAAIDGRKCIGCCQCISLCPEGAIGIHWSEVSENTSRKMAEYAAGVALYPPACYLNFLVNITPNCDCLNKTEKPFHPDVGVFGSLDPVACDQACFERVEEGLRRVWPKVNPEVQLEHAERVGLGSRAYELNEL